MNKILILDEDESIRILYADELMEDGYDVITNVDLSRVLEFIERENPDVVVMDVIFGERNGLDILQDIRNTYYNLPVVLCTAYKEFKYDAKSIAADYYVLKSSDFSELKTRIRMAIEGYMPYSELEEGKSINVENDKYI